MTPCYDAVIEFIDCKHSKSFKIGCQSSSCNTYHEYVIQNDYDENLTDVAQPDEAANTNAIVLTSGSTNGVNGEHNGANDVNDQESGLNGVNSQHNGVNGVNDRLIGGNGQHGGMDHTDGSANQNDVMEDHGGIDGTVESPDTSHQSSTSEDTGSDASPEYQQFDGMPPSDVLIVTAFRWMCEACHDLRTRREVARKQRVFQVRLREIDSDTRVQAAEKPTEKWNVQKQHQFDMEQVNKQRSAQALAIRGAIEWTLNYAQEVYHYLLHFGNVHNEIAMQVQEGLWKEKPLELVVVLDSIRKEDQLKRLQSDGRSTDTFTQCSWILHQAEVTNTALNPSTNA